MKNLNLLKAMLLALFLLVSSYTFSNSVENSSYNNKFVNALLTGPITSISPALGHAGTVVTITDVGGSFLPASTVTLAGVPIPAANVVFVNANNLQVTIPCGATSGTFSVDGGTASAPFTYIAPTVNAVPDLSACDGFTVPALPLSGTPLVPTTGTLLFTWTSSNPAIGLAAGGTGVQIPSFTASNSTSSPITSTITITPEINSCPGLPITYTITVNPTPDVNPLGNPLTPVCDGTIVSPVVLNSTVVGTTYTWSGDSNAALIGMTPTSGIGSPIPGFTAINTTNATITATFTVIPTANGCAGNPDTYTISVLPVSVGGTATASTLSPICSGGSTTITLTGYTGSIQWQTNASGSFVNIPSATSATYTTPALISTTSYQAIVTTGACTSATSTVATVTVDPISVGGTATASTSPICSGGTSTITLAGSTGSIQWQTDASGSFVNIPSATSATYTTPALASTTSYRAIVTSGICPSSTSTVATVIVDPANVGGAVTGGTTICSGNTSGLLTLAGNTGLVVKWQSSVSPFSTWTDIVNTAVTYTSGVLTQTTQFRAVVQSGVCPVANSAVTTVIVDPTSVGGTATATTSTICSGGSTTITLAGHTGNIQWQTDASGSFVNIPSATSSTYTTPSLSNTTSYRAMLTSGVCIPSTSTVAIVTVNALPSVTVNNQTVCQGNLATVTATPSPSPAGSYSYNWSIPAGATPPGNVASFTTTIAGDYTVVITEIASPNCQSLPATGKVIVNPLPTGIVSGTASVCQGTPAIITFIGSIGLAPYTFTYTINGGAPQTIVSSGTGNSASIAVPTPIAGPFSYNLVSVTDSSVPTCSQLIIGQTAIITVLPIPNLFITNPLDICQGFTTDLTVPLITTGSDPGLTYTYWTNPTATNPYLTPQFATAGTYFIKADNGSACSTIKPVVVTAQAAPTVTVNSQTICVGGTATITATPSSPGSYNYSWTVPAGATFPGNVASFSTSTAGNYTVVITNQLPPLCDSLPATGTVTVNPLPTATISGPSNVCLNESATIAITGALGTAPYIFTYTINGGPIQTAFATGNSIAIPVPTAIVGPITYNLLSVTDSNTPACTQPITGQTATIMVNDLPVVNAGLDITVCAGEPVTLTGMGAATTYTWDNGVIDGVAFVPIITATYTVTGTDSFGCKNTDQVTVTVIPQISGTIKSPNNFTVCNGNPSPDITFVGSGGLAPYTFTYEISSSLLATPITGTVVSFPGNEAILVPQIPTTTAGSFTVTLLKVEDSGFCKNGNLIAPKEAFITVLDAGISPVNPIYVDQIVCENAPIVNIVFKINGSPTNAYVDNLPGNVISTYNPLAGELTISGAPNTPGTFNYIVKTSGSLIGCNTQYPGTITVNATGKLSAASPAGSDLQSLCINNAITTINYTLQGAATGATVVFTPKTPAGITWTVSGSNVTISGTPTETGMFNYTVETFSTLNSCLQITKTGSITINESTIILVSGNPIQTACISNAITPIDFDINSTPITLPAASLILVGTLPTGVTFDSVTGIISGTPTQGGLFPYTIEASTGCAVPIVGTITVNNTLPSVLIEGGLPEITACKGSMITLTATGADTYEWYKLVSGSPVILASANVYTYSPTTEETIYVIGRIIGGCDKTAKIDVKLKEAITATITGVNTTEVCKDSTPPTITFKGSNGTIPYLFTYTINSITNTVASVGTSDSVSISIPTNVTGTIDIVLTNVTDASGSIYCSPPKLLQPTTAKITVVVSGISPQAGTPIFQTICEGTPISNILFDITGDATGAYALGLPSGIIGSYGIGGVFTISGTPIESGTFNYSVFTSGLTAACNSTFTGTITVNANDTIRLLTVGNNNQQICLNSSIVPILYELGGSATGATVSGLPVGITGAISGNSLTISGASNAAPGSYNYTITTQGICNPATATGVITIIQPNTLVLTSGNKDEVLCVNSILATPIIYTGIAGQTLVLNGLLPPGMTFTANPSAGSATIDGAPTLVGNYLYSITTDNSCGDKLDGSILVGPNTFINYVSGGLNQVACIGTPIESLKYAVPLNVNSTTVTITPSLPIGLLYVVAGGELIISGTPTSVLVETSYDITVNNGCGTPAKSVFKLTVVDNPVITLEADSGALNQSVCQNGQIVPIKFKLSGAATGIDLSLLPTFITSTYDAIAGIYTLSGAPKTTGVFNFNIKTTGGSSCSTSLAVTISNLYAAANIVLSSASGTDNQIICSFKSIVPIVYDIIGSITTADISVIGLPGGIIATKTSTTTGVKLTISGTPIASGIFNYNIVYKTCVDAVTSGKISISSPITVTGKVTPITCGGNDGKIEVTIFGGTPFIDSSGTPYYAITWSGPNGFMQNQTTITGLSAGVYTLNVVDAIGCALPTAVTYTIAPSLPINVSLTSSTNMSCNGTLGCANFSITGGTGIYTSFLLQYLDPSSQVLTTIIPANNNYFNICGLKAGLYYLTATDSNNCKNAPYLFTIYDYSLLSIKSITYDNQLCNNAPGKIKVEVDSADPKLTFYYNSVLVPSVALGNNTYELTINNPTTPSGIVKVNDSQNCSVTTTVTSTILAPDFEFTSFEFENYGTFSVNSSIEFTNLIDLSKVTTDSHIVWDFGDRTPFKVFYYPKDLAANASGESFINVFHSYAIDGFYEVTMTLVNNSGCSKSITKLITIGSGASMVLPTAFSPNSDGINDLFRPSLIGLKEVAMYIYDEWGNLVYEVSSDVLSLTPDWGWNGIEKVNTEAKNGTYRYYIMAKANDNKIIEKEGRFLLIK